MSKYTAYVTYANWRVGAGCIRWIRSMLTDIHNLISVLLGFILGPIELIEARKDLIN